MLRDGPGPRFCRGCRHAGQESGEDRTFAMRSSLVTIDQGALVVSFSIGGCDRNSGHTRAVEPQQERHSSPVRRGYFGPNSALAIRSSLATLTAWLCRGTVARWADSAR